MPVQAFPTREATSRKYLYTALRLNKDLELAQKFLAYLEKNDLLPKDFLEEEAPTAD